MRIRDAQCAAARADVMLAEVDLGRTEAAESQDRADRDAAESFWSAAVQTRWPEPALVQLAGSWLIERENALQAARIDTRIAASSLDAAMERHRHARARLDASSEIAGRFRKDLARKDETRSLAEAADAYLRRRG